MGLSQQITLGQQQKLSMTPRLQQAIQILQMNQTDLLAFLEAEALENPLLEVTLPKPISEGTSASMSDFNPVDMVRATTSQIDQLTDQVALMSASPQAIHLAGQLIGELDENGYLTTPIFELADRLNSPTEMLEAALDLVHACEPTGTGARNLQECLTLQLVAKNRFDPVMEIVLDNLDLVACADISTLSQLTNETPDAVKDIIKEIQTLNPRPATCLTRLPIGEITPDILIKRGEMGEWHVSLVPESLPRVLVNNTYAAEISASGEQAQAFTARYLETANWLVQALDQRAKTILKTATAIVQHQFAFFDEGPIAMRPLKMREIAESIDMHESTVSRVSNGKFLTCRRGTFELKYFFSAKIPSLVENLEFSALGIRTRIKRLFAQESHKNVLSDDAIVNILREEGADVARRTIAKYRESMGIPSSNERRRLLVNRADDLRC